MSTTEHPTVFPAPGDSESGISHMLGDRSDRAALLRGADLPDVGALFAFLSLGREHHAVSKEARERATSAIGKGRRNRAPSLD